jgi:hypothetical protein
MSQGVVAVLATNVQVFDEVASVYDEVLPFFAELGRQVVRWWIPAPAFDCSIWVPDAEP